MKIEELVGKDVIRTNPLIIDGFKDTSYITHPVHVVKYDYLEHVAVVSDSEFGYGAILGNEWLDDNWHEASKDFAYVQDPMYDYLYHIVSIDGDITIQGQIDNGKFVRTKKGDDRIFGDYKRHNSNTNVEDLSADVFNDVRKIVFKKILAGTMPQMDMASILAMINNGVENIFSPYSNIVVNSEDCSDGEYILYQLYSIFSNKLSESEGRYHGISLHDDKGNFICRISPSKEYDSIELHYTGDQESLHVQFRHCERISVGIGMLFYNGIYFVPSIEALFQAYNATGFDMESVYDAVHENDISDDNFSYVVYTFDEVFSMIPAGDGETSYTFRSKNARTGVDYKCIIMLDVQDSCGFKKCINKLL